MQWWSQPDRGLLLLKNFKTWRGSGGCQSIINNHLICDLEHELWDDPVEDGAPVGEALLVLAAGDAVEVPGGPRHHLVKQLHHDPAPALAINGHIEKYPANMDI